MEAWHKSKQCPTLVYVLYLLSVRPWSISFIEVYGNATPAAEATGPKYQHFDNTLRQNRQNYKAFGTGQMVIFG
jgi:hypothetical protein